MCGKPESEADEAEADKIFQTAGTFIIVFFPIVILLLFQITVLLKNGIK